MLNSGDLTPLCGVPASEILPDLSHALICLRTLPFNLSTLKVYHG